jgi:hypothetical protein
VRSEVRFLVVALFLHDRGIYVFIPASGADMHLFRPWELIKVTSAKATPERGNKKRMIFDKTEQFYFFLFLHHFPLRQIFYEALL